jgi:hypothetical protein
VKRQPGGQKTLANRCDGGQEAQPESHHNILHTTNHTLHQHAQNVDESTGRLAYFEQEDDQILQ